MATNETITWKQKFLSSNFELATLPILPREERICLFDYKSTATEAVPDESIN